MLLIRPNIPNMSKKGPERSIILPPLGLEILATNISDIAEVKIFDNLLYEGTIAEISSVISNFKPNYVGISCCYTFQISHALKIARVAKKFGINTVLGGWHPTLAPNETINYPSVDIVIHGEGELTFRALIENQSPFGVKGLSYKENGKVINNKKRELMDLSNLRIIDRTLRSQNRKYYYNFFGLPIDCIEVSRGCPFSCDFCCIHEFYQRKYRKRSIKSVIHELKLMSSSQNYSDIIYIVDDNFVVDPDFVIDLCDAIIKNGIKKYFFGQARVDMIVNHPEVFKKMADAGFVLLFIGLESFSNRTLKSINKQIEFNQIKSAVRILHNYGYLIQGSVIIGANLDDTKKDLEDNIILTKSLEIDIPTFSLLTPFPGTKLMERVRQQNLLLSNNWKDFDWSTPLIKYQNVSSEDLYHFFSMSYSLRSFTNIWKHIKNLIFYRGVKFHLVRLYNPAIYRKFPKFIRSVMRMIVLILKT